MRFLRANRKDRHPDDHRDTAKSEKFLATD
jgi:hypothetical protein